MMEVTCTIACHDFRDNKVFSNPRQGLGKAQNKSCEKRQATNNKKPDLFYTSKNGLNHK